MTNKKRKLKMRKAFVYSFAENKYIFRGHLVNIVIFKNAKIKPFHSN